VCIYVFRYQSFKKETWNQPPLPLSWIALALADVHVPQLFWVHFETFKGVRGPLIEAGGDKVTRVVHRMIRDAAVVSWRRVENAGLPHVL
jgi:hypothetical protein